MVGAAAPDAGAGATAAADSGAAIAARFSRSQSSRCWRAAACTRSDIPKKNHNLFERFELMELMYF